MAVATRIDTSPSPTSTHPHHRIRQRVPSVVYDSRIGTRFAMPAFRATREQDYGARLVGYR